MKRIGLVVAYDGTNYSGWQVQPNGITVQSVLNETLSQLLGEQIETIGASRTDAGVHAMGNVAVFDTETRIPGEKISYALNQRLPEDIRIQLSEEVDPDFHPDVLFRQNACNVRRNQLVLGHDVRLHPDTHCIIATESKEFSDALDTLDARFDVDIEVIRQEIFIV